MFRLPASSSAECAESSRSLFAFRSVKTESPPLYVENPHAEAIHKLMVI
jgi:hypothetical protein